MADVDEIQAELSTVSAELKKLKSTDKDYDKKWQKQQNLKRALRKAKRNADK